MSNPVADALREVVSALRTQGGFNDKSVERGFRAMADQLEKRADYIEAPVTNSAGEESSPLVLVETVVESQKRTNEAE